MPTSIGFPTKQRAPVEGWQATCARRAACHDDKDDLHFLIAIRPPRQTDALRVGGALAAQGRRALVFDDAEITDDIVRALQEVIVSLCARLYGKRARKKRAKKALEAIQCESC